MAELERPDHGQVVLTDRENGVLTLTLNRPAKRNALNSEVIRALRSGLTSGLTGASSPSSASVAGDDVRVILLRAAGGDFCAGADLDAMRRMAEEADPMANVADAEELGELLVLMRRHPRPIIAAVQGHALAGGAGLATACDLVLAREDAVFGYPEVHLGFVPAMVMALLRRTVGEKVAFELVAGGDRIGAEEAAALGIVNRVVREAEWEETVTSYAEELAARSSSALSLIKRLLYGMDGLSFEESIARGAEVNAIARLTPDTREGLRRFLDREE